MAKYKNKDGIELNCTGNDIHTRLVKEVIGEAIRLCEFTNYYDKYSAIRAINTVKDFLKENFDMDKKIEDDNQLDLF